MGEENKNLKDQISRLTHYCNICNNNLVQYYNDFPIVGYNFLEWEGLVNSGQQNEEFVLFN